MGIDVWSCGVILYALLTNTLPFLAPSIPELFRVIKRGRWKAPYFMSADAEDLIRMMLTVKPDDRISIAEVRKHRWFAPGLVTASEPTQVSEQPLTEPISSSGV